MPKRKSVESEVKPVAEGPSKKRTATKAPAATHKRAAKKTLEPATVSEAAPIALAPARDAIARLAYSFWEQRGYRGGSPDEDWLQAERQLLELAHDR